LRASQAISIVGAAMVLGAFAALQFRKVGPAHRGYLTANVFGSGLLAVAAGLEGLWAFVALNTIWGLVSLRSLIVATTREGGAAERPPEA
jgi:hypothetical protein